MIVFEIKRLILGDIGFIDTINQDYIEKTQAPVQ